MGPSRRRHTRAAVAEHVWPIEWVRRSIRRAPSHFLSYQRSTAVGLVEPGLEGLVGRDLVRRRAPPVRSDRARRGAGVLLCGAPRRRRISRRSCMTRRSTRQLLHGEADDARASGSTSVSGTRRRRRSSSASSTRRRRSIRSPPIRAHALVRRRRRRSRRPVSRSLSRRRSVDRLGPAHLVARRRPVQPAQLSQRLGVAPRHRAGDRRRRRARTVTTRWTV